MAMRVDEMNDKQYHEYIDLHPDIPEEEKGKLHWERIQERQKANEAATKPVAKAAPKASKPVAKAAAAAKKKK